MTDENEKLRMQLVACGIAALGNTESATRERLDRDHPYWSSAYGDVCNAVDREIYLRNRRDELEKAREWQPISTVPRDGTVVDLWHKTAMRTTDVWWDSDDNCWNGEGGLDLDAQFTHWRPIPQPPKE